MEWIIGLLREHPELAIFLTLGVGFWVGQLKIGKFSLGTVTSVLLIGVVVGQLNIAVGGPMKAVFFLLFLFSIGYKVGPQFFRGLKKDGLPQVLFAALMCIFCLVAPWLLATMMGYNIGEAVGLLAGSQTISAVIGVSGDTIKSLNISEEEKNSLTNAIPVAYAVTYVFGTAGSAWVLGTLGPKLLGGLEKVKQACKELEIKLGSEEGDEPGFIHANRPVVFRAYRISNDWFGFGKTVSQLEEYFSQNDKRLFVERVRKENHLIQHITPDLLLRSNDEIVLSGRREYAIEEEQWIGHEVFDPELLHFTVEVLPVMITRKGYAGQPLSSIRRQPFMHGVSIRRIRRAGIDIPVFTQTIVDHGDVIELIGLKYEVEVAATQLGYIDRPTNASDMIFVGLGILIGGVIGTLTLQLGGVPLSLSTSGGALIAGLFLGWFRSKRPNFGQIPEPALWILNNVGLNMFIAVVGIASGPSFIQGFKEVGVSIFLIGALATTIPLLVGVLLGRYVFKFHPALTLGCTAGARTTTAALGAIQDSLESQTPALGYTVTYAVGNTLLIIWGVAIVLLMS